MRSLSKIILHALCALALPLFGQTSPASHTVNFADNTVWCATHNCFTSVMAFPLLEIKAGGDGTVYGRSASGVLYNYTAITGWVQAASALQSAGGYGIVHISVGSAAHVLALSSIPSGNNVFILDSAGTAWTALSQRLVTAEIGADGSIWGMDSVPQVWSYVSGVWTDPPGQLSNIANAGSSIVWGVNSSGTLEAWNGTAFAAFSPAPNFTPSHAQNAIASIAGLTFPEVAVVDTAGVIHIFDGAGSGPALRTAISSKQCTVGPAPSASCIDTVTSTAGISVGDSITETGNSLANGTWVVASLTATSVTFQATGLACGGTRWPNRCGPSSGTGGTLTDNSTVDSNSGKWSALQGSAVAVTGGRAMAFALNSSGNPYHLNLMVPQITESFGYYIPCDLHFGCHGVYEIVQVSFGGAGGAHGTAGVTVRQNGTEPANVYASAVEQAVNCDSFIKPTAAECIVSLGDTWTENDGEGGEPTEFTGIFSFQYEIAYTQAYWGGAPAPVCVSSACTYVVKNNCISPPDDPIGGVVSGDYRGIATYISWMNAAACIRFGTSGPWTCFPPTAWINSMNVPMPPYACTSNP